ncbi:hypothetical protein SAMN05192551_106166 [Tindallia magadiensis]|uniref:Uncharacterized protein n=1 Tax=Tindallia magadiensis TaxID=69895 RepID=A0A1I3FH65_9FIRM|nr:hypothetical protein SAMN05192551_106166 [Tindallia magadiensis]
MTGNTFCEKKKVLFILIKINNQKILTKRVAGDTIKLVITNKLKEGR